MKYSAALLLCLIITLPLMTACSNNSGTASNLPVGKLRIITEESPPFNFTYQDGKITGQSTEIVREILKRTGSQAGIEMMSWSEGYNLVQKEPNAAIYSTSRIPQREGLFKWVGPIGYEDNYFYIRKDSGIRAASLEEAKKVGAIAVYRNDSNHLYLAGQGFTNLDISDNLDECLQKLVAGKVDMWLGPSEGLYYIALTSKVNQSDVKPVMYVRNTEWYIAFNKAIPDTVVNLWQSKLDEIKKVGAAGGNSLFEQITLSYMVPRYIEKSIPADLVVQLVGKTARDIAQDAQDTFRKINNKEHPYLDRNNPELYVFVYNTDITLIANADNPSQVGRSLRGVADAQGKLYRDQIVKRSAVEGPGWQDYVFTVPGRIGLFYKTAYFSRVTGSDGKEYIVCSGRYKLSGE